MRFQERLIQKGLYDPAYTWLQNDNTSLFARIIKETQAYSQAPFEMVIMSLLGALSAAAQGCYDVRTPVGTRSPTSLYLLTIAESGERKTSVETLFFKPLREFEAKQRLEAERQLKRYKKEHKYWLAKEKKLVKQLSSEVSIEVTQALEWDEEKDGPYDEQMQSILTNYAALKTYLDKHAKLEPKPPAIFRFLYDDTTPSALLDNMHRYSPTASLVSSEASSVIGGQAFRELHHLNTLWSDAPVTVDRVSKESFILEDARLSFALMTQQVVIDAFIKTKGEQARGMGFLARFLVVVPHSTIGQRMFQKATRPASLDCFAELVTKMIEASYERWKIKRQATAEATEQGEESDQAVQREALYFSDEAVMKWKEYADLIEEQNAEEGFYQFATDHASKLMDNVSRLAALLHLLEGRDAATQISAPILERAFILCMNFSSHYMRVFTPRPALVACADAVVRFILHGLQITENRSFQSVNQREVHKTMAEGFVKESSFHGYVHRTTLLKFGPPCIRPSKNDAIPSTDSLDKVLGLLAKMGHIQPCSHMQMRNYFEFHILPQIAPILRNGYGFTIDSLPHFDDLEPVFKDYIRIAGSFSEAINKTNPVFIMKKHRSPPSIHFDKTENEKRLEALKAEIHYDEYAHYPRVDNPEDPNSTISFREAMNYLDKLRDENGHLQLPFKLNQWYKGFVDILAEQRGIERQRIENLQKESEERLKQFVKEAGR